MLFGLSGGKKRPKDTEDDKSVMRDVVLLSANVLAKLPEEVRKANIGGDSCQRRKAQRIVRPIHAIRPKIWVSSTREQMRRIEDKQAEFTRGRPEKPSLAAEKIRQMKHAFDQPERVHDTGISRHHGADLDALCLQGDWKRARNIGKLTNLDQGIYLRGDRKHAKGLHTFSLSIIGCVITQIRYGMK